MKFIVESSIENIPCDFFKIITDFANDICRVFPEYNTIINKYILSEKEKTDDSKLKLYNFVGKVIIQNKEYILSKNEELFLNTDENVLNTEFLPRIVFSHIWEGDISEITKTTIWKYLTLLFVTISKQQSGGKEEIDLDEILSRIMDEIGPETETQVSEETSPLETQQQQQIPGIGELPEQFQNMMGGSLGKLAMELAQETSMEGVENKGTLDLFSMMGKIGSKIENKLKSGELSESSLLEESMGLINSMGGANNIQSMMNMFKGGASKGGFDFSALQKMTEQQPSEQPQKENRLNSRNGKNSQKTTDKKARQKLRGNNPRNMADTNNNEAPEYTLPRFTDDELERIFSSK
jgi:hypothetical protein